MKTNCWFVTLTQEGSGLRRGQEASGLGLEGPAQGLYTVLEGRPGTRSEQRLLIT